MRHTQQLITEGADILDIGGESTRPGAITVSVQEELDRVLPVIEGLRGVAVPLSVDTCKPEVMRAALAAGVQIVNDINALQQPEALAAVVGSDAAVCLMHKQGRPKTMQIEPHYEDVLREVIDFAPAASRGCGCASSYRGGSGLAWQTLAHNLILLVIWMFSVLACRCWQGYPQIHVGCDHRAEVDNRVSASVAAALLAVQRGASIVRVHDVRATCDALKIWNAVNV
jgi:dihydropteroate synthase